MKENNARGKQGILIRLFTGIAIPEAVVANIEEMLSRLRPLARVRWSPSTNLHITTKFIGYWPEPRLGELENALAGIERPGPIPIEVSGFGFFPNARRPRVFFTHVNSGEALHKLASLTDEAVAAIGCPREERPYSPHLTLARLGDSDVRALREKVESLGNPSFGSWDADQFHLYLSRPSGQHSIYTILASWPLTKETIAA